MTLCLGDTKQFEEVFKLPDDVKITISDGEEAKKNRGLIRDWRAEQAKKALQQRLTQPIQPGDLYHFSIEGITDTDAMVLDIKNDAQGTPYALMCVTDHDFRSSSPLDVDVRATALFGRRLVHLRHGFSVPVSRLSKFSRIGFVEAYRVHNIHQYFTSLVAMGYPIDPRFLESTIVQNRVRKIFARVQQLGTHFNR